LEVEDLSVEYHLPQGKVKALDNVNLTIDKGEVVGVVGESGSGKSTLAHAVIRLVKPPGKIVEGRILFNGKNILELSDEEIRKIRGKEISMIFQDPSSYLNPVYPVGFQVAEVYEAHENTNMRKLNGEVVSLFKKVRITDSEVRVGSYPHELSGGMKQRILIAMAIALKPKLLIADEPTSALDTTIQAEILSLLNELKEEYSLSILFISHDVGVVSEIANRMIVMYAGKVVEEGPAKRIVEEPLHPYTKALVLATKTTRKKKLFSIPGTPPDMLNLPKGCPFHPRCPYAKDSCKEWSYRMIRNHEGGVACAIYENTGSS
ncbi:MAG: ABC transporter ATP-binding protein, partial [Thermoproteota archaeon]